MTFAYATDVLRNYGYVKYNSVHWKSGGEAIDQPNPNHLYESRGDVSDRKSNILEKSHWTGNRAHIRKPTEGSKLIN